MGKHLMKPTSLEKTQSPVSGLCHAQHCVCDVGNDRLKVFLWDSPDQDSISGGGGV